MPDYVTKDYIIRNTHCPDCGARPNAQCLLRGKDARKKMRARVSHFARMQLAQVLNNQERPEPLIDEEETATMKREADHA